VNAAVQVEVDGPIFSEAEQHAFEVIDRLPPADWADEYRQLDPKYSNEPGGYRTSRTPYIIEPLNCWADPFLEQITVRKATQCGFTEMLMTGLGWTIDQQPRPLLYVVPTETDAKGLHGARIRAMIQNTPQVSKHATKNLNDLRGELLHLDAMLMKIAWPTPAQVASMAAATVVFDEADKFGKFVGKEGNLLNVTKKRMDTYRGSGCQLWVVSSPALDTDHTTVEYEKSDKRRFWVPCPFCGEYQILVWPQVKFPEDERDPEIIKIENLASYECIHCSERIMDGHKPSMLVRGRWCPEGCEVRPDGSLHGQVLMTSHRGYEISSLYSPWVTFSQLAAEWLESQGDQSKLQDFCNNRLAEPWKETLKTASSSELRQLEVPYDLGTVPEDAAFLTCGIDVQKDHVWYSVRAWGAGETSWLVDYGRVERHIRQAEGMLFVQDPWRDIVTRILRAEYPRLDTGELVRPRLWAMDSGHFTDEVYGFCARYGDTVYPTKGSNGPMSGQPYRPSKLERDRKGRVRTRSTTLWWVDTFYYKPKLQRLMSTDPGLPGCFYLPAGTKKEYVDQVTAEEKTIDRKTRKVEWTLKQGRAANHLGDCEVLNLFLADLLGCPRLTAEDMEKARMARRRAAQQVATPPPPEPGRGGWMPERRGGWLRR
jgi:phage terminase large subunit GpA-like protein